MNKNLSTIIHDLLKCQVKTAERQGLDEINITVPRARELIRLIREENKCQSERAHGNQRLEAVMRRVERAALADYGRGNRLEVTARVSQKRPHTTAYRQKHISGLPANAKMRQDSRHPIFPPRTPSKPNQKKPNETTNPVSIIRASYWMRNIQNGEK